jgi:hypothetical protein
MIVGFFVHILSQGTHRIPDTIGALKSPARLGSQIDLLDKVIALYTHPETNEIHQLDIIVSPFSSRKYFVNFS